MVTFFQLMVSGLITGSLYALIASGFLLIYKASSIFNFAQGELVLVAAYLAWTIFLITPHMPYIWLGIISLLLMTMVMGFLIERFLLRPLTGQPLLSFVMMTLALSILLRGICFLFWKGDLHSYPPFLPEESLSLHGVKISAPGLVIFVMTFLIIGSSMVLFKYTKTGLAMRTAAEDKQVAQSVGIRLAKMLSITWAVACCFAGGGALLMGVNYGVGMHMSDFGIRAIPAALLGGLESLGGVLLGGLILGVTEQIAIGYFDPILVKAGLQGATVGTVIPYIIIVVILLFKPYGLFGLPKIERI